MDTPKDPPNLDHLDPKDAIDLALIQVEEAKKERKRQWWIHFCDMPPELTFEEAQVWAKEEQAKSDASRKEFEDRKEAMYAELDRRMHERMLKIGFPEDELDPYSHMPPSIAASDPRSEAFDVAFQQCMDESRAMYIAMGVDLNEPADSDEDSAAEQAPEPIVSNGQTALVSHPEKPKSYLFGWHEVADALGMKNEDTFQRRVKRFHELYVSPIIFGAQGTQPTAVKDDLIASWNSLETRFRETNTRIGDREATISGFHDHGREGSVIPEIGGSEKGRKPRRQQKDRKTST